MDNSLSFDVRAKIPIFWVPICIPNKRIKRQDARPPNWCVWNS